MSVATFNTSACSVGAIQPPVIFGTEILNLSAQLVTNFSAIVPEIYAYNHPSANLTGVSYCNVTITYTHPGQNDTINTEIWAPVNTWNGRMQGVGGGGLVAGRFFLSYEFMKVAIGDGYVGVTTDAGLPTDPSTSVTPDWSQVSPGNVNLYLLQDLASVSLNESAFMGKSVINSLYGKLPEYSYFSGCSQGGRQGLMLAQRYPEAYDGVAASAPAINWSEFITGDFWPQLWMNILGQYPQNCEFNEIVRQSIQACDPLDGVVDGLISNLDTCEFDPFTVVGMEFNCSDTGLMTEISNAAATIINETWTGPHTEDNEFLWYGIPRGANLTGDVSSQLDTVCSNGTCKGSPNSLPAAWITWWLEKNPNFNITAMGAEEYIKIFKEGVIEYQSLIETNNPDLSKFKARGGKIVGYHGLADPIIQPLGTRNYYDRVTAFDGQAQDFWRHFEAPGLGHCYNGPGAYPSGTFAALVDWVENGNAPESLTGYLLSSNSEERAERKLCPYPQKAVYDGVGDQNSVESYDCE